VAALAAQTRLLTGALFDRERDRTNNMPPAKGVEQRSNRLRAGITAVTTAGPHYELFGQDLGINRAGSDANTWAKPQSANSGDAIGWRNGPFEVDLIATIGKRLAIV
jgi:hypothetical protein